MNAKYWQRGEAVDFTNNTGALIRHDEVVPLGDYRIGVAGCDIPAGATKPGSLHVDGVFIMPKDAAAIALGQPAFYNATDDVITATETGNVPAGWAVAPAAAGDTDVMIRIGG